MRAGAGPAKTSARLDRAPLMDRCTVNVNGMMEGVMIAAAVYKYWADDPVPVIAAR